MTHPLSLVRKKKKHVFILFFTRLLNKFLTLDKNNIFFLHSLNRNFRTFAANNKYILNMSRIQILDKTFETSMPEAQIKARVKELALEISKDMEGKNPLFLAVLNGAFIFAADLMREMTIPCEISFVKLASYQGTTSTGKIKEVMGINENLAGRTVVILEDIVETGLTIRQMIESLGTRNPASVHVCTMFFKPERLKENVKIDYVAFNIPNDFILGYGLDYDQQGRGLKDLYTLVSE